MRALSTGRGVKDGGAITCPNAQWGSTIVAVKRPQRRGSLYACVVTTERTIQRREPDRLLSAIPVIVVTVRDPGVAEQKARECGAVAFLQKPVKADELIATIQGVLGTQE
jgi:FixJ family two-component response regulator